MSCGFPLEPGQQWCLHCGSRAPDKPESHSPPGWRSAALVLGATAVLVVGAAAAGYAALTHKNHHAPRVLASTHPSLTTPATTPPATTPPSTPGTAPGLTHAHLPSTPLAGKSSAKGAESPFFGGGSSPSKGSSAAELGSGTEPSATPPSTPSGSAIKEGNTGSLFPESGTKPGGSTSKSPGFTPTKPTKGSTRSAEEEAETERGNSGVGGTGSSPSTPTPMVLAKSAASTYNPYHYPASRFGNPALAIDGNATTAWTAKVDPAVAPLMAEGLLIDLKTAQRVGSLSILTSTTGMVVQVVGTTAETAPTSITDKGWVKLSRARTLHAKTTTIQLSHSTEPFRLLGIWISEAPPSSTASAPGEVSLNEVVLYEPR